VDRFGNLQLAATSLEPPAAHAGTGTGTVTVTVELSPVARDDSHTLRCVETFSDLAPAELGLLHDANGHLAVVAAQASAARELTLRAGELVELSWN
jgi:S-adenosylmethionine hydrolase